MAPWYGPRRKVFISFYGADEREVLAFVTWAESAGVLIPRILHDAYSGDFVNSTNPDYVMDVVRRDFLEDSTVTLVMIGTCTHSRRYVDWELKASLRQGEVYTPNGLLAISLPSAPRNLHLPPRFQANWRHDARGYARWYAATNDAAQLGAWIEEGFASRTNRAHLISNSSDMMGYNAKCNHCGITHPAG